MKILSSILALLVPALHAQSAQIQLPGVVQPAQTITITTPRNGGKVTFTIPQQTLLKPSLAAIPPSMVPNYTFSITLTSTQAQQLMQVLSSGGTETGITINLTAVKP